MYDTVPVVNEMLRASAATTVGSVLQRLIVAAALGGAIGVEREMKQRPAGLRTNMFMCFGSALFTVLSVLLAGPNTQDPTRIAAQIITGIGFIGAGSILHPRADIVHGVTTAATIFVVAAIGMCAGAGLLIPAALATGLVLFGLLILGLLEQHIFVRPRSAVYQAAATGTGELYGLLEQVQVSKGSKLVDVKFSSANQASQVEFTLRARPETHSGLQRKLHDEFESHKIISFSTSEQE